jgi:hypothetical protein
MADQRCLKALKAKMDQMQRLGTKLIDKEMKKRRIKWQ